MEAQEKVEKFIKRFQKQIVSNIPGKDFVLNEIKLEPDENDVVRLTFCFENGWKLYHPTVIYNPNAEDQEAEQDAIAEGNDIEYKEVEEFFDEIRRAP